jgi:hypothetical protein
MRNKIGRLLSACISIPFTFISHVLELKYFTGTNTFEHAEFKTRSFFTNCYFIFTNFGLRGRLIASPYLAFNFWGALLKNVAEGMFLCSFPVTALDQLVKIRSSRP